MPLYRTELGVVVDIPQDKAARIGGMIPIDSAPPTPRKATAKRPAKRSPSSSDKD